MPHRGSEGGRGPGPPSDCRADLRSARGCSQAPLYSANRNPGARSLSSLPEGTIARPHHLSCFPIIVSVGGSYSSRRDHSPGLGALRAVETRFVFGDRWPRMTSGCCDDLTLPGLPRGSVGRPRVLARVPFCGNLAPTTRLRPARACVCARLLARVPAYLPGFREGRAGLLGRRDAERA